MKSELHNPINCELAPD